MRRIKYQPRDETWLEKEKQTIRDLQQRYEELKDELEPEEPGVDELLVETVSLGGGHVLVACGMCDT